MAQWHAKPRGGYALGTPEADDNLEVIYGFLTSRGWTLASIAGMCGNLVNESGLNPWRWQSDSVSLSSRTKGYGLAQFTPAYGYIYGYGTNIPGFAPNLSTSSVSGGNVSDGYAQLICIEEDRAGKFINRSSWCSYANINPLFPMSNFIHTNDLWLATVAWLFHYEAPAKRGIEVANLRYNSSIYVYQFLSGKTPEPPPPYLPPPVDPQPSPDFNKRHGAIDWELRRRLVKPF